MVPAFQGAWNSMKCLSVLVLDRFSRVQLAAEPEPRFRRSPANRGPVRFLRRAEERIEPGVRCVMNATRTGVLTLA
jgi:hypothetical protein